MAASGSDEETFFPHESSSDDDADLSDRTKRRQGYQEVIENAVKQEVNRRMQEHSRYVNVCMHVYRRCTYVYIVRPVHIGTSTFCKDCLLTTVCLVGVDVLFTYTAIAFNLVATAN